MSHPDRKIGLCEPLDLLWGVDEIGHAIRRNRRQAHYLLEKGELPGAKKVGGRWCIPRTALHDFFGFATREAA